jgi:hypothetical protein
MSREEHEGCEGEFYFAFLCGLRATCYYLSVFNLCFIRG